MCLHASPELKPQSWAAWGQQSPLGFSVIDRCLWACLCENLLGSCYVSSTLLGDHRHKLLFHCKRLNVLIIFQGEKCDLTPILKLFFPDTWSDVWNRIKMISESKVSSQRVIVWVMLDKLWDRLCDKQGPSPFSLVSKSCRACTYQQALSLSFFQ